MAGLIPQAFIDDLLSRADIVDVVDKRVKLRKTGKNYSGLCPFHQEKSPSFSVEPDKQFFYCFGCGAGGNALGFVMNYENVEFPRAVEILAGEYGLDVPREASTPAARQRQSENARLLDLLEEANRFYQQQLRQHDKRKLAVDYLKTRGLSGTIARDFMVGYAPPGWDNLLARLGDNEETRKLLLAAGMVIEKSRADDSADTASDKAPHYYDRFRNRIMFPIRDNRGRVIAFGGRVLGDDKPKYLNSPETPVFQKGRELYGLFEARRANRQLQQVVIVEGYMDVIALAQAGISNAVATLGTACSSAHLNRLFRLVSRVGFCFDGDEAGRAAAWRALQVCIPLLEDGREVRFLFLSEGDDPDSLVRREGAGKFQQLLEHAMPLEQFFFEKLSHGLDLTAIADKARLGQLASPFIRQFPKGIYAQLILDRLSDLIGMNREAVEKLLVNEPDTPASNVPDSRPGPDYPDEGRFYPRDSSHNRPQRSVAGSFRKPWSLKAIELILANPDIVLNLDRDVAPLAALEDDNTRMLLDLIELVRNNPHIETYTMLGYFYGSPVGNQLTQLLRNEKITPTDGMESEFLQIIDRILSDIKRKDDINKSLQSLRDRLQGTGDDG